MTTKSSKDVNAIKNLLKKSKGASGNLGTLSELPIEKVEPSQFQTRRDFNEEKLQELADTIKNTGQLTAGLVIRDLHEDKYYLLAGERRWRACKLAGKTHYKAEIYPKNLHEVSNLELLEISVIENEQREDLNPMEQAHSYVAIKKEGKYKDAELAQRMGKSRQTMSELLTLNKLPKDIQEEALGSNVSKSHLVQLVRIKDKVEQTKVWQKMKSGNFSVREVKEVKQSSSTKKATKTDFKKKLLSSVKVAQKQFESAAQNGFSINQDDYKSLQKEVKALELLLKTLQS